LRPDSRNLSAVFIGDEDILKKCNQAMSWEVQLSTKKLFRFLLAIDGVQGQLLSSFLYYFFQTNINERRKENL
jgi:hypothetical protein